MYLRKTAHQSGTGCDFAMLVKADRLFHYRSGDAPAID